MSVGRVVGSVLGGRLARLRAFKTRVTPGNDPVFKAEPEFRTSRCSFAKAALGLVKYAPCCDLGLCTLRFQPVDKLAHDPVSVVTAEAEAVAQRDADG